MNELTPEEIENMPVAKAACQYCGEQATLYEFRDGWSDRIDKPLCASCARKEWNEIVLDFDQWFEGLAESE